MEQYDTNLIHHELVFPLLKALSKAGDMIAKNRFKEEIARRYGSGYQPVMLFLEKEGYLSYLNEEERLLCVKDALENNLRKLDYETVTRLISIFGRKLEAHLGREEYLYILLNKNDAEVIIELGNLIGKEIIIKRYVVNGHFIRLREGYKDPKRSPGTAYSIEARDKSVVELNLNGNNLKKIPETILSMEKLNYLSIVECGIEELPNWIRKLKCLINLAGNPLNEKSKKLIKKFYNIIVNGNT